VKALTLEAGTEWRFNPLILDLDGDGHPDLVATARIVTPALHMWVGDGKGAFTPLKATWTDIGYAALAQGDINGDGFPDIVAASHFGTVQTLLSDGRGGFTERILRGTDGYVAAELADLNEDGQLDLILVGYEKAGVQVYFGDGTGNWRLHTTLPEPRPGQTLPGRALVVGTSITTVTRTWSWRFNAGGLHLLRRWPGRLHRRSRGFLLRGAREFRSLASVTSTRMATPISSSTEPLPVRASPTVPTSISGTPRRVDPLVGRVKGPQIRRGRSRARRPRWRRKPRYRRRGNMTGNVGNGYGLFWFRGDGKGGWRLVQESGLPNGGLSVIHSIRLADVDHDGLPEIIVLTGGRGGSITIWKRRSPG